MSYGFPVLLAGAFVASFLLALLNTGRWKTIFLCIIAIWGIRISQTEIDLLNTGTTQAYAWFAFLAASVWFPTFVVAMIGTDLGARLHHALFVAKEEHEESEDAAGEPMNQ